MFYLHVRAYNLIPKILLLYCLRFIREILLKQKLINGDDLNKLSESTNEIVKKISIVENENREVSISNFI